MTFITALVLGLLASAHCATMCSGLQHALQPSDVLRSKNQILIHALVLNLGRICCYGLVGGLLALSSVQLLSFAGTSSLAAWLRAASATIIFLIGLQMILRHKGLLTGLEPAGHLLWNKVKVFYRNNNGNRLSGSFVNGLTWGMLPCGLLYSVYLTAALSGDVSNGVLIMLGFGLGTLPSMLLSGRIWMIFKHYFHANKVQVAGGLFYCLAAIMVMFSPFFVDMVFAQSYPGLVNAFFCLR